MMAVVFMAVLNGCDNNSRVTALLSRADSLMSSRPDSALKILENSSAEIDKWPKSLQMRYNLLLAKAQNKAYVPFSSDSVMTIVTSYYDRHGTSNERMEAHYLLGCVYRDLGEAPKALSAYHDALECSDTTTVDCDYALLSRLHAQIADLFQKMQLPYDALEEADKALKMSIRAKDSVMAIDSRMLKASAYYLLGNNDSVISISEYASSKYLQYGDSLYSSLYLKPAISGYINKGMLDSARKAMTVFEDLLHGRSENIIDYTKKNYYVIKAYYYLKCNQYDSAFYYYQYSRGIAETKEEQINVLRGFSNYYIAVGDADSALKYVDLYVSADDDLYRTSIRENFAKMQSLYNYEHSQCRAEQAEHQVTKLRYRLSAFIIVAIVLITFLMLSAKLKKERMVRRFNDLNQKYTDSLSLYAIYKKELEQLKELKELDEQLILQLECEKNLSSETISKLNDKIEKYKVRISRDEEDLRKLSFAISEFQKDKERPDQWNLAETLFNLPVLSHLHVSIAKGRRPSDAQFDEIIELMNSMLPTFVPQIVELYPRINRVNLLFCIFTKLRFINSERAVIFDMSYQSVTNRSAFLYNKLTGKKGGAGDFEALIQKMG